MTGTGSNAEYDEFIVDSSKLNLVKDIQPKVERMFSIDLDIDESTDNKGEKSWLRVVGLKCDRKHAREYILAVCHPESKQRLQIKDSDKDVFDEETLEDTEAKTCACITLQDKTLQISGSELAVILAMTTLEGKGTVSVDDTEPDGENDEQTQKPKAAAVSKKNKWSNKMDSQLEKLLCNPGNTTESLSMMDFAKSSPSVKMTILKCMTDMDDVSDSDLFPSCRDEAPPILSSNKLNIYSESDDEKMDSDSVDGKTVKHLTEQLTAAQISPSPGKATAKKPGKDISESNREYFKKFGNSVGYSDEEIEEGLFYCDDETTPADFLKLLNDIKEKKKKRSSDEVSTDGGSGTNFPPPPDVPSQSSASINGRRSLPNEYKKKLVKDFIEETSDLSVEDLKKRNAERQKVLKNAFDKGTSNIPVTQTKSPKKKKRKKNKQKKGAEGKKFIGDGSEENPAMLCSSDDDKEQTKVMTIWNEDENEASDSDDCMIVDETFPEKVVQKGKIVPQPEAKASQGPPPVQYIVETRPAPNIQPTNSRPYPEAGASGDVQSKIVHPSLEAGPVSSNSKASNLRYVVIDGSNVAMCHGCNRKFSCRGIKIVIDYFLKRGHTQITAFVPEWRRYRPRFENPIVDQPLLQKMQEDGHLVFTPSRRIGSRLIACYDDRFVLELAEKEGGIIVSNDQYRDLMQENYSWKKIIEERLLQFTFVGDNFMPPYDPLGRHGPNLDEFLCKPQIRRRGMDQNNPQNNRDRGRVSRWDVVGRPNDNFHWRPQAPQQQGIVRPYQRNPTGNPYGWARAASGVPVRPQYNTISQPHQGPGGAGRGAGGKSDFKSPLKSSGPVRSPAKTREIEGQLKAIFPENGGKISAILQNHPSETDVEKLTNYLMNAIFSA